MPEKSIVESTDSETEYWDLYNREQNIRKYHINLGNLAIY